MYSEIDFPLIAGSLAANGNDAYAYGYDGYTFYQTMSWDAQSTSSTREGRGLFTEIPGRSAYSGWVCYRNTRGEYDCKSQYIPVVGGLDEDEAAPDLY